MIPVGEVLPAPSTPFDNDRADGDEFLQRPVDGVRRLPFRVASTDRLGIHAPDDWPYRSSTAGLAIWAAARLRHL